MGWYSERGCSVDDCIADYAWRAAGVDYCCVG